MSVFHFEAVLESSDATRATYRVCGDVLGDPDAWGTMTLSTDGECTSTGRSSAEMRHCVAALRHKVLATWRSTGAWPKRVAWVA